MRIFYGFLILVASAILWLLPVTEGVYAFKTDVRIDEFVYTTGVGATTANVTLLKPIYDNDTSTIDILSDDGDDAPLFTSYATGNRALVMSGLADNATRTLSVSYDYDALNNDAWETILNIVPFLWACMLVGFPVAGLLAIFTGKAG